MAALLRRRLVRCGLWALGLMLVAAAVAWSDWRRDHIRGDLTRHYMAGARALAHGGNPYSADDAGGEYTYRYFPLNATLLVPLTLVPVPVSQGIWFALSIGLLVWACYLHREGVGDRRVPWWVWAVAFVFTWRFLWANLKLGQLNPIVYCLAFGGLMLLPRRRWLGAGLLGLAGALKYMPAFFLLYLVAKRRWRDAGATALAIAFWLLVVPSIFLGPARHAELFSIFRQRSKGNLARMRSDDRVSGYSLSATLYAFLVPVVRANLDADLQRPINLVNLPPAVAAGVVDSVALAVFAAACALSFWLGKRRPWPDPHRDLLEIGLWFVVLLLFSLEVRKAHLMTLFTAVFALLVGLTRADWRPALRRTAAALLAFAFLVVILSSDMHTRFRLNDLLNIYGSWTLVPLSVAAAAAYALVRWPQPAPSDDSRQMTNDGTS